MCNPRTSSLDAGVTGAFPSFAQVFPPKCEKSGLGDGESRDVEVSEIVIAALESSSGKVWFESNRRIACTAASWSRTGPCGKLAIARIALHGLAGREGFLPKSSSDDQSPTSLPIGCHEEGELGRGC